MPAVSPTPDYCSSPCTGGFFSTFESNSLSPTIIDRLSSSLFVTVWEHTACRPITSSIMYRQLEVAADNTVDLILAKNDRRDERSHATHHTDRLLLRVSHGAWGVVPRVVGSRKCDPKPFSVVVTQPKLLYQ